ncbi:MAG: hypothetical protein ACK5MT_10815 [Actinomycetales bacterium]
MAGKSAREWSDLSRRQKALVVLLGSVQLALAVSAWADLARRPAEEVRGSKRVWAGLIAINWFGPLGYFGYGVRRD